MKITPEQLVTVIENGKSNPEQLRQVLKYIFSFKENIDIFSLYFFPQTTTNKIPDFHREIYDILFRETNDAFGAPRGHAKQIADNTPVLTSTGWKTHGALKVGDYIFSPDGNKIKVIGKNTKTYSDYIVKFRNGEEIRCHELHEWCMWDRNKKREVIIETRDMLGDWDKMGKRSRFQLPFRNPVVFSKKMLEINPYFLGLWLGDGSECKSCITHSKEDMASILDTPYKISTQHIHKITGVITTSFGHNNIIFNLRKLKIYGNKRIPEKYFQSSIAQRLELLAGLIDSDGHVDKVRGRVRFINTNYNLIKDVERLVISLGCNPYITSQNGGKKIYPNGKKYSYNKVFTVNFTPILDIPVRLLRKKINRFPKRNKIGVTRVEYSPNGEMGNCIEVDSKDGLYLIGKTLIPTHNSSIAGLVFLIYCIVHKYRKYIVYVSENHTKTVQFLSPIRFEFKNNEKLQWVYGNLSMAFDKEEDGKDREDCFDICDTRVEAVSFEKNLRGFKYRNIRPDLIILDDIENDMRVLNPELRVKDADKLNKIIIPSLDINGYYKFFGTLLHFDSLLYKKIQQLNGKIFSACDAEFNNILWDDRFTKEKLMLIKKEIGTIAFQQEYLNNPIDNTCSLIKREWIISCFDENLSLTEAARMEFNKKVLGVDFAFSDRITADNSAFTSVGEYNGKMILFHAELQRGMSVLEQLNYIKNNLHIRYRYDNIGLEENSIKSISKDIPSFSLPVTLFWTSASDPQTQQDTFLNKDYIGKRHTVGKINLIQRLGTAFENRAFVIPYKTDEDKEIAHRILAECTSFALADGRLVEAGIHPDYPIALGYCLEQLSRMTDQSAFFFG